MCHEGLRLRVFEVSLQVIVAYKIPVLAKIHEHDPVLRDCL